MHQPVVRSRIVFNKTATTEICPLSLHDALPICGQGPGEARTRGPAPTAAPRARRPAGGGAPRARREGPHRGARSEEHTSELQSRQYLVCRLLLEKNYAKATAAEQYTPRTLTPPN